MRHDRPAPSQCKMCKVRIPHSPFARPLLFPLRSAISPGEYKRNPGHAAARRNRTARELPTAGAGTAPALFFGCRKLPSSPSPDPSLCRSSFPPERLRKGVYRFRQGPKFSRPLLLPALPDENPPTKKCLPEPPRFDKHFRYITLRSVVLGLSPLLKTTLPYPRRNTTKLRNPAPFSLLHFLHFHHP